MIGIRHLDWMEFIWTSDLPPNAKLLAAYLSRYMNKDKDHAFPALKRIECETGLGHATVLRNLNLLEANGWLKRHRGGGRNHVTHYHVAFPSVIEEGIKQVHIGPVQKNKQVHSGPDENDKQVHQSEETGPQWTSNQQRINKPFTSEKNSPTRRKVFSEDDLAIATWMFEVLKTDNPDHKPPNLKTWANDIRLMRERDNRKPEHIRALFAWAHKDSFWCANILSPGKLREKWEQLAAKRNAQRAPKLATDWQQKAARLGMEAREGESWGDFKARVLSAPEVLNA